MAERKSFVVYKDWEKAFSRLSVMQMGTLFLALFAYVNRGQPYEGDDQAVGIAFDFACTTLDRDNEKYQVRCAANARNGQKGGRPRKDAEAAKNPPETDGFVEHAEGPEETVPLPPEPDVFFEGLEEPAAFAEYPPEPAGAAEEYPPEPQTGDRAFCAAAPSCTSAGAGASRGRSPEPPASHGAYGVPSPNPAGRTGCPVGQTYGASPPMSAGRAERSFEDARRRVIQQLQREQFESYVPSRAAPTGGW